MNLSTMIKPLTLAALLLGAGTAVSAAETENSGQLYGGAGSLGLSGNMGYYTYGMNQVNERFRDGRDSDFYGGLGVGGSLKLGVTQQLALRVGMDYLYASRDSHRTILGVDYETRVELPATLIFIGGELVFLPLGPLNLKLIGGYTLVSIYSGRETGREGALDLGAISGTGSGFQAGVGAELFLMPTFSLGAELGYNYANIEGATFAGGPADPNSVNWNGTVDYSGVMAKVVATIYLIK